MASGNGLFAIRDARIYLLGQSLSLFGDMAFFLAMGIWVKTLTGSNAAAGLTIFAIAAPSLLAPFFGVLVDRVRRRPLLLAANLALAVTTLALLFVRSRTDVWLIYLVMALYGVGYTILSPAQAALVKAVVPDHLIGNANAFLRTMAEGLRLVGPLIGAGVFVAVGGHVVALIDAATFLVAAFLLTRLQITEIKPVKTDERFIPTLLAGFRYIAATPAIRVVVVASFFAFCVIGFTEVIGFAIVSNGLHRATSFVAVIVTIEGAGAIAAGLTATAVMKAVGELRLVALGMGLFVLGALLLIPITLYSIVPGAILLGASLPWIIIGYNTLLQRRTPDALLGRVFATANMLTGVPQTVSIAVGALLISVVDYRILLAAISLVVLASGIGLVLGARSTEPTQPPLTTSIHEEVADAA